MLICLLLLVLIIVLQIKINKVSSSENQDASQEGEADGKQVARTGRPAPELELKKKESTFQNIFLGNIFNKIGAIAIIVALIFFIKLVSTMIVITPLVKFISAYVCGLLMIGGAFT